MLKTKFTLACPACAKTNKFEMGGRVRCGNCRREFTPTDLTKAVPDKPVHMGTPMPADDDEQQFACKDGENCGWEGPESETDLDDNDRACCPDCGKRVRKVEDI